MNEQKIKIILLACSVIRHLIESKSRINVIANVNLHRYKEECEHLNRAVTKIDCRIKLYKYRVQCAISELNGFDKAIHMQVDYISTTDIENGFIDISLNSVDEEYLNLITGEIVSCLTVPENKRNR